MPPLSKDASDRSDSERCFLFFFLAFFEVLFEVFEAFPASAPIIVSTPDIVVLFLLLILSLLVIYLFVLAPPSKRPAAVLAAFDAFTAFTPFGGFDLLKRPPDDSRLNMLSIFLLF